MAKRTSSLKTIAYELGLSINTVSRALRDCSDISESTKENVRKKAYELGYIQSTVANFIKRDEKKLIAIAINNLSNLYFSIMSQKLSNVARFCGYDFTIIPTFKDAVDDEMVKQCLSQRVDAIISCLCFEKKAIDICKLNNIPVCLVGNTNEDDDYCDTIISASKNGDFIAANYLTKLHRINKLVFISNNKAHSSITKYECFKDTLQKIDSSVEVKSLEVDEACNQFIQLMQDGYYGFYCFSDETAYKLLSQLNTLFPNVRTIYPKLHIVGYDALCTKVDGLIDITSIQWDFDRMCELAFQLIEERFTNNDIKSRNISIPVQLHQRKIK